MRLSWLIAALCLGAVTFACSDDGPIVNDSSEVGTIWAAFGFDGPQHDVGLLEVKVVPADADCSAAAVAETIVYFESEYLPTWVDEEAELGLAHPFGDALFVVQPGEYRVCATPLTFEGEPSEHCAATDGLFGVDAGMTTENLLIAQCLGDPTGGLDVVVGLNDPPQIDGLMVSPSKFLTTCDTGEITVEASDLNGDDVAYTFEVIDGPSSAKTRLANIDGHAWFQSFTPGPYLLQVTVTDGLGGEASLTFPIHVSWVQEPFEVSQEGQDPFMAGTVEGVIPVEEFYSYDTCNAFSGACGLILEDTSLTFIYRDLVTDEYSLVIIHDVPAGAEEHPDGGTVRILAYGLYNATGIVVEDDPQDFYAWDDKTGLGEFIWHWSPCCTDGLAIDFASEAICVTLDPVMAIGVPYARVASRAEDGEATYGELQAGEAFTLCHCLAAEPFPPAVQLEEEPQ